MAIAPAEPRVSSSSINMGQSVTITHSSPSSIGIKRYTITWSFAGQSGTLATQTANTSTTWTPALATFAAYIPNAVSGVATITCATYDLSESSSAPVGTKSCTVTLLVPSSVKPTLSSVSVSEGNTSLPAAFSGNYVKGYSKFKISFTASGANGSTIKSARYTCDGKTYTSTYSAATVNGSITSNTLTQVGTGKSVSVTVTDSRGRTASTTVGGLTVKDYSVPQITSFRARRSSGDTASATGTNAQRYIAASVTSVGTNSITSAVLSWKQKNASVWATSDSVTIASSGTAIPSSGSAAWTVIAKSGSNVTFDGLYSYDFKLEVTDKAGNTTTSYTYISTISVMLDFNDTGNGLGIGMINQNTNSIDSAWTYRGTGMTLTGSVEHLTDNEITSSRVMTSGGTLTRAQSIVSLANRFVFRQFYSGTSDWEQYALPYPSSSAASETYSILTSKNAVTVDQGGTGATDAAGARTNLGLGSMATESTSDYLPISGGTLTGALTLANAGLNTASVAGFTLNQYGNFIHRRSTATDTWNIMANDNTVKIAVTPETGATTFSGAMTVNSSLTIGDGNRLMYTGMTDGTAKSFLRVDGATNRLEMYSTAEHALAFYERAAGSTYFERYILPNPSSSLTAHKYYTIATSKSLQTGRVASASRGAGSATGTATITFPTAYTSTPVVLAQPFGSYNHQCEIIISSVTATGFSYSIANSSSSSYNFGFMWLAFGNV